ncbi:MAG: hypothetical protein RJA63_767 [Pseudomonadota bacterium]|jgi:ATP-dependent helicase/nuclease subunit A
MTPEHRQAQRFIALDPARSVAVEACAGSGKTWLLTSRLLRLLLSGARPGQILAITYTRKAAREIEARLRGLLAMLATADEATVLRELQMRGLAEAEARRQIAPCRALLEAVLRAEPPITITTFHGWFARLLGGAPLDSGLAGRSLDEAASSLLDEAWVLLAADCSRSPDSPLADSLLWLYRELGAFSTKNLLRRLIDRRAEWRVWCDTCGGSEGVERWITTEFGVGVDPLAMLFTATRLDELEAFARLLGLNTASDQAMGNALAQAVVNLRKGVGGGNEDVFECVRAAFLTATNTPRARKASAAQAKRLGAEEETYLRLHAEWSERLIATIGALQDLRNAELNRHALRVGEALLVKLDQLKQARRVMDFSDLEAEIDGLLAREGAAAYLQARLDARYKHILLDEFQDTNPLQWRILRGWLDAYASAGVSRPSVFLVGDPKQSIYRFRRAEPKLFAAASKYFADEFGAIHMSNAHTFRNAQPIVAIVNEVFSAEPLFMGFTAQTAEREDWPGRVEVMPLIPVPEAPGSAAAEGFRNPLEEAREEAEDLRRSEEADVLARRIARMVGLEGPALQVQGKDGERAARFADILILTRRTTQLATYEAALRHAGIPFVSPGRGGLLNTLEAQDLLAALRFLADPADNHALAHVLRTPAFGASDDLLLALSAEPGLWWPRLQALAQRGREDSVEVRAVTLLQGWLAVSAYLPAHDLIDRVFHEADWLARCRAAVPPAQWPGVHANLEALLELSLNVDAGRYPSLTRFVDELRRLSSSDEEAPDEGLVNSAGSGLGRVRILTIHSAKGLEAPIVWLIDAHTTPRPPDGFDVVQDWPADALAPRHFSLLGRVAECGPVREPLLAAEREAALREELNLLYVAVTRAEQVFIVSGIASARAISTPTAYSRLAAAVERLGSRNGVIGEMPEVFAQSVTPIATGPAQSSFAALRVGQRRRAQEDHAGMLFGTALHAWLEAHTKGLVLPEVATEVERCGRKLVARPSLARFFTPGVARRAGSEVSFVDQAGKIGRIDRWVDDGETVWVLDYKSGGLPEQAVLAAYRDQLTEYRDVMCKVFRGRRVKALLIFSDAGELEV